MLGNFPLASSPLADDGSITVIELPNPAGVTAGAPVIGSPALSQDHGLSAPDIQTNAPAVEAATVAVQSVLAAAGITAGSPNVGSASLTQNHPLRPNAGNDEGRGRARLARILQGFP